MVELPKNNKSIKITAVSNGFMVELPTDTNPMADMLKQYANSIGEAMQGAQMDDIEKLIQESLKLSSASVYELPIETSVFVFDNFQEVVKFLNAKLFPNHN